MRRTLERVISVTPTDKAFSLAVRFQDGTQAVIDLENTVMSYRVFTPLRQGARFGEVAIVNNGFGISWGGDMELSAESLRLEATRAGVRRAETVGGP